MGNAVTAVKPLSEESVTLINEIWDHIDLIRGFETSKDSMMALTIKVRAACASDQPEFNLRKIAMALRDQWRKVQNKKAKTVDGGEDSYTPEE